MTAGSGLGEPCYAAGGLPGTAASSIVERAPAGRLFGAISTLSDAATEHEADTPPKTKPARKARRTRR